MRWAPLSVSTVAYDGHPLDVALASLAALGIDTVELAYIEGYSTAFDESVFSASNARDSPKRTERSWAELPGYLRALRSIPAGRR